MADNAIFGMAFCHFTISFTINLEGQRNSSVSFVWMFRGFLSNPAWLLNAKRTTAHFS